MLDTIGGMILVVPPLGSTGWEDRHSGSEWCDCFDCGGIFYDIHYLCARCREHPISGLPPDPP